jgi:hypothetical protein
MFGPLHKISPSSAILTSTSAISLPTVPNCAWYFPKPFTEITGEVSVRPYPSNTGMLAAQNTLAKRGCKAAPPDIRVFTSPPKAARHLGNTNTLAMANWK